MITLILSVIFATSGVLIVILLLLIFLQKRHHEQTIKRTKKARNFFYALTNQTKDISPPNIDPILLFDEFFLVEDQVRFSPQERTHILQNLPTKAFLKRNTRHIKSLSSYKRIMASQYLALLQSYEARNIMMKRLKKERKEPVKFYLAYGLIKMMDQEILSAIIDSCKESTIQYTKRITHLLSNHYQEIYPFFKMDKTTDEYWLFFYATLAKKERYVSIEQLITNNLEDLLKQDMHNANTLAFFTRDYLLDALLLRNDDRLSHEEIIHHNDSSVRKYGYQYLAQQENIACIKQLLNQLSDDKEQNKFIIKTLTKSMTSNKLFDELVALLSEFDDDTKKKALASIMSSNIDYIIMELNGKENLTAKNALTFIIKSHHTAALIAFLNQNKDQDLEDMLFAIIAPLIKTDDKLRTSFTTYLNKEILSRHGLPKTELYQPPREKAKVERAKIIWMFVILFIVITIYPLLSLISQRNIFLNQPFIATFKEFILDTNYNLIYYFMSANLIYLFLLALSLRGAKRQRNLWKVKSEQLLYEEDILPAISIIAPAYNEELSIISSVQSLLNLKYPAYEVVVVNDGSKDQTLQKLIEHFELKREDENDTHTLRTKEIRGVYANKNYPKLLVINKVNGGKADALNVGINMSNYPYVCGIDADSVLEQEALLRLMSITLDHKDVPVALGGNITPANGCTIDHGYIEEKQLPHELIPRFQSLEYLRAFTSGRIGWSSLDSLLIISGAFGLFKKDDIIKIGGYITSTGVLNKDSVGEDMELVVRLTHNLLKQKQPYLISYVYHANCYTELPSDAKTLLKQRNRWHRGLIDILSYHRSMLLKPKYKQIGLFALPYFYIFEVMGPFFELIGYLALITSFAFGFLSPIIVLGIFAASIVMGMVLSLASLYIAETVNTYTTKKDVFILLLFAFLENIGYRQIVSMHRVYSFFTALFESGAWGEQKRKGI